MTITLDKIKPRKTCPFGVNTAAVVLDGEIFGVDGTTGDSLVPRALDFFDGSDSDIWIGDLGNDLTLGILLSKTQAEFMHAQLGALLHRMNAAGTE